MPSRSDVEELRREYEAIRRSVEGDLRNFWSYVDLSNPDRAAKAFNSYVPLLVQQYSDVAATVAAEWYDDMRAGEGVPGRFRARPEDSPYQEASRGMSGRAAGELFTENPERALAIATAKAPKYALAAGRQTVIRSTDRDPRARGWKRVTSASPCKFCRMLAGRGAVYSKSSVHFAAHGECGCASTPEWDPDAPEVSVAQYQASRRTTNMTPAERSAHNALIRRAIGEYT